MIKKKKRQDKDLQELLYLKSVSSFETFSTRDDKDSDITT